tara:strand:+ start:70934 stop:71770 length:837 start_codon:yes stop_codon:yes gene_type:complete
MVSGKKIGLGLVTCDRNDYLLQSLQSVLDNSRDLDCLIVCDDGASREKSSNIVNDLSKTFLSDNNDPYNILYDQSPKPYSGVAHVKNRIISTLMYRDCDYIFIMEDDMLLKNPEVFQAYIHAMEESGIHHMNFAKHGTANYKHGFPTTRVTCAYNTFNIGFYPNLVGSFSVYTKECLDDIGMMDDKYINAMEHVDHTYMASLKGYHPPFWWFPDLEHSLYYINEIEGSISNTARSKNKLKNEINGMQRFEHKHGVHISRVPLPDQEEVIKFLKEKRLK